MSSPEKSASDAAQNGSPPADEKPRLTEQEKKRNHIESEQKRRQNIRGGFDRITELVPGLEGMARSEGVVLERTVKFIQEQVEERRRLVEAVEAHGGHVDESLKKPLHDSPGGQSRTGRQQARRP